VTAEESADDEVLVLRVPRMIPAVVLGLATLWGVPLVVGAVAGSLQRPPVQLLNVLVALGLLWFGLDTLLIRVRLDPTAVVVRRGLRSRSVPLEAVRGVALLASRGTPRLRVVTPEGSLNVPAWSLRARHPDGEVEPAAAALPRFGAAHGVKVHVRVLTGPRAT
jgi:hypothetical protein